MELVLFQDKWKEEDPQYGILMDRDEPEIICLCCGATVEFGEYEILERLKWIDLSSIIDKIRQDNNNKNFEFLRKFIGEKLILKKEGSDFVLQTKKKGDVLITSDDRIKEAICLTLDECESRFEEHVGHKLICVCYGKNETQNIAIECEDCYSVLYDIEKNN